MKKLPLARKELNRVNTAPVCAEIQDAKQNSTPD